MLTCGCMVKGASGRIILLSADFKMAFEALRIWSRTESRPWARSIACAFI